MTIRTKSAKLMIRLTPELLERLKERADSRGATPSEYARTIITEWLAADVVTITEPKR